MPSIPGTIRMTGVIAPSDVSDTYPVTDDVYGKGGHRPVANEAGRKAITLQRRKEGMLVYQIDTGEFWTLIGGIADINWSLITFHSKYSETFSAPNNQIAGIAISGGLLPYTNPGFYVESKLKFIRMTFWAEILYIAGSPNKVLVGLWNGDFSKQIFEIDIDGPFLLPGSIGDTTDVPIDIDTLDAGENFWITFACTPSVIGNKITANWLFQVQGVYV